MENQEIEKRDQGLAQTTLTTSLKATNSIGDNLKCQTIAKQIQTFDRKSVIAEITGWVSKCAFSLDIEISKERLLLMSSDIMDTYTYESLEDVRDCLKKARQGQYGWGLEKRGVINMVIIRFWMDSFLEKKSIERQRLHEASEKKNREAEKTPFDGVDYEAYKIRSAKDKSKNDKAQRAKTKKEMEFLEFKNNYLTKTKTKTKNDS